MIIDKNFNSFIMKEQILVVRDKNVIIILFVIIIEMVQFNPKLAGAQGVLFICI